MIYVILIMINLYIGDYRLYIKREDFIYYLYKVFSFIYNLSLQLEQSINNRYNDIQIEFR